MSSTANELFRSLERIESVQSKMSEDINQIKLDISQKPCAVHAVKIKLLQTVVYGMVGLICIAFMGSLLNPGAKAGDEVKKAKQVIEDKPKCIYVKNTLEGK